MNKYLWMKGLGLSALLVVVTMVMATAALAADQQATVVASSLNIRATADGNGEVIGSLKQGTTVTVKDEQFGWMKIAYGNVEGWVAGYYLSVGQASNTKSSSKNGQAVKVDSVSSKATVSGNSLRLRKGPGQDHKVVTLLSAGTSLSVLSSSGDWLNVQTGDGYTGWVHGDYVNRDGAANKQTNTATAIAKSLGGIKGKVIVIDPGHGGDDQGTKGTTYHTEESTINLSTSKYLVDELKRLGAKTVLTRSEDKKVSLPNRVQTSIDNRADAFVSVHYNSATKPVSGSLIFYYSDNRDRPLARAIENRLGNSLELPNNGIASGDFHVLRNNVTPSVLIELAFLSNAKDEKIVRNADYQQRAAQAIANGLADYFAN